jgi:serine phosphatase RsbU (regulator of sigma subunit)
MAALMEHPLRLLSRVARGELGGSRSALLVAGCVAVQAIVCLTGRWFGANQLIGIHGVLVVSVAVVAGLVAGAGAGGLVGGIGAGLFVLLVAYDTPPNPTLYGLPIIALWAALGASTGAIAATVRREGARARAAEAEANVRLDRLYVTVEHLAAARERVEVAGIIAREGAAALEADAAWIGILDHEHQVLARLADFGFPRVTVRRSQLLPLDAPVVWAAVVREGEPRWLVGPDAVPAAYPWGVNDEADGIFEAAAVIPLAVAGERFGFVCLLFREPRAFPQDERELALAFATTAAQALERARLFDEVRRAAETLQRSLLPGRLPSVAPFAVAARYRPATDVVAVGGDWYDVIELGPGCLGVSVGDVAGKGVDAAAVMGRLRTAMRAYAMEHQSPAEVLRLLFDYHERTRPDAFATVVYAVLDADAEEMRIASAGHLPPVVARADHADWLEIPIGAPLGVGDVPVALHETTIDLHAGDVVILFTDGVVERRTATIDSGVDRIREVALGHRDASPGRLADLIIEAVPGSEAPDDRALIVVSVGERTATGGDASGDVAADVVTVVE